MKEGPVITFDQLPAAVSRLFAKLDAIEHLLKQTQSTKPVEEFLDIKEASLVVRLAVPTIYSHVSAGTIPHYKQKQGKRLYFKRQELLDWLASGNKKTNAEITAEAATYSPTQKKRVK